MSGKVRPTYVTFLKYSICLAIVMMFFASIILICYGPSVIEPYIPSDQTVQQANCLKNTWLIFLIMNLIFCLMGLIGFVFERIACAFFFNIYCFFVAFGAFFDTVSRNHWFLLLSIPITLSSLIMVVIMRIEKLDPPPPVRKYSIYTNVAGKS
jgi:hypothetical protein